MRALSSLHIGPNGAVWYTWIVSDGWFRPVVVHHPPACAEFGPIEKPRGRVMQVTYYDEPG